MPGGAIFVQRTNPPTFVQPAARQHAYLCRRVCSPPDATQRQGAWFRQTAPRPVRLRARLVRVSGDRRVRGDRRAQRAVGPSRLRADRCAGATLTSGELLLHCRRRLALYKVPKHVIFVGELPHNSGGKVLKPELPARFAELNATASQARIGSDAARILGVGSSITQNRGGLTKRP